MEYQIGQRVLNDWQIEAVLGKGGFGKVYKVSKTVPGLVSYSALKVISIEPPDPGDPLAATADPALIIAEYGLMYKLRDCAHVVRCEDIQQISHSDDEGFDILIRMELLTPISKYQREHTLDAAEVTRLGVELCRALAECNRQHIIHRDIKPDNIMIAGNNTYKLADFGIARIMKESMASSQIGTPYYMAPEVQKYYIEGQRYGATVDLYSLGIVMYQLLNHNRIPLLPLYPQSFTVLDRDSAIIRRNRGDSFPPPDQAPLALAAVIMKACAYNPDDRWQSAAEMAAALEQALRPAAPSADMEQAKLQWERKQAAAEVKRQAAEATRQQEAQRQVEEAQQTLAEARRQADEAMRQRELQAAEAQRRAEQAKQQAAEEARRRELETATVGSVIKFGTYPQGAKGEKAPIEWIVLEKLGNWLLLLSKQVLDCKKYNKKYVDVTWESCTLRQWLNREFIDVAFSQEEQSRIGAAQIRNPDNAKYHTKGGNDTSDRVFLLSIDEAKGYFRDDEARRAKPTAYAKAQGVYTYNGYCWWWLRSPGNSQSNAVIVYSGGGVYGYGFVVNSSHGGVRPALFANL